MKYAQFRSQLSANKFFRIMEDKTIYWRLEIEKWGGWDCEKDELTEEQSKQISKDIRNGVESGEIIIIQPKPKVCEKCFGDGELNGIECDECI